MIDKQVLPIKERGKLFLCPTPIGNLEDITIRTINILKEVDFICAEDTRHTKKLLTHFEINKPLLSYHEHNKVEQGTIIIDRLLAGENVGLVSDAGMPAISDPGADLVSKAIDSGIEVIPLPGANAALTALIASGLSTLEFVFVGFLPKRQNHRLEELRRLESYKSTLIFYESPHRLEKVIKDIYAVFGNRRCTLARELTKKFEEFYRDNLQNLVENIEKLTIKGEFVILVEGETKANSEKEESLDIEQSYYKFIEEGLTKKEAIRELTKVTGQSRRNIYNYIEKVLEDKDDE